MDNIAELRTVSTHLEPRRRANVRLGFLSTMFVVFAFFGTQEIHPTVAQSRPDIDLISAYAQINDVTWSESESRLKIEARATRLSQELERIFKKHYAGIWITPDNGRVNVGVQSQRDFAKVRKSAAAHGLLHSTDVQIMERSIADLDEVQSDLSNEILGSLTPGSAILINDIVNNTVDVQIRNDLSKTDLKVVQNAVSVHGDSVEVDEVRPEVTDIDPNACSWPNCDRPLRGGVNINGNSSNCTAGFMTVLNSDYNVKRVLTAGHCITPGDPNASWYSDSPTYGTWRIGPSGQAVVGANGDYGLVKVSPYSEWFTSALSGTIAAWNVNTSMSVTGRAHPIIGQTHCRYGQTTKRQCGTVQKVDVCGVYPPKWNVTVCNQWSSSACAMGGDSGGPAISAEGNAIGITASTPGNSPPCSETSIYTENATSYYQDVIDAERALSVRTITPNMTNPPGGPWSTWSKIAGSEVVSSGAALASRGDSKLSLIARSSTNAYIVKTWTNGGAGWTDWQNIGGGFTSEPAAVASSPSRVDVVGKGNDNAIWHAAWDAATGWSNWQSIGSVGSGMTSAPAISSREQGALDVFVRGPNNDVLHKYYHPGYGGWSGWGSLGGGFTSKPAAVSWGSNRIDVVAKGLDDAIWHTAWTDGFGWSSWESLGAIAGGFNSGPAISSRGYGKLDIFVRGTNGSYFHKYYDPEFGGWSGWGSLGGGFTSDPASVSWSDHRIDVVGRGLDNAIWHSAW